MTVAPKFSVRLTRGAERDLEALYDFMVENRSVDVALTLMDTIMERLDALQDFPDRGAIPKELAALGIHDFRQIVLAPYRLFYRVVEKTVFIVLIADGRRDMQSLLEQRLLGRW